MPNQLFQSSGQRWIAIRISIPIGADDYNRDLRDAIGQMNQKRQRGFVGPVQVLEHQHVRA